MKIRKAIIPAAGLGTRVLPASKSVPKEMLNIVDKPAIQYIVEEAAKAGIEDILIITNRGKGAIEDHFDHSFELETQLAANPAKASLYESVKRCSSLANIYFIRQKETKGLAHAILAGKSFIGNEPCAVLYGDDVIINDENPVIGQMCRLYEKYGKGMVGVKAVPEELIPLYCTLDVTPVEGEERLMNCYNIIEKPKKEQILSPYAILGRVILPEGAFELIEKGIINGVCKKIDNGKVVASFLLGSQRVYDYIDHNEKVQMRDIKYTNDPWVIARTPGVVSINFATEVDLTGQICADSIGTRMYSGTGGQLDFVKGARRSQGGKSVIALPSRTRTGKNKISPVLTSGAGVITPRADAEWIVTEYGAVNLYGRSLQERSKLLTSIAHPDDREMLEKAAFERFGKHYLNLNI